VTAERIDGDYFALRGLPVKTLAPLCISRARPYFRALPGYLLPPTPPPPFSFSLSLSLSSPRRIYTARPSEDACSRGLFSWKLTAAGSLHVPHKEKRLHLVKAFTMRRVLPTCEGCVCGRKGRKRGVKRKGRFYRGDVLRGLHRPPHPSLL